MISQSEFEAEVTSYVEMFIKGCQGQDPDLIRNKSEILGKMIVSLARATAFEPRTEEEVRDNARKVFEGAKDITRDDLIELGLSIEGLLGVRKRAGY